MAALRERAAAAWADKQVDDAERSARRRDRLVAAFTEKFGARPDSVKDDSTVVCEGLRFRYNTRDMYHWDMLTPCLRCGADVTTTYIDEHIYKIGKVLETPRVCSECSAPSPDPEDELRDLLIAVFEQLGVAWDE